MPRRIILKDGGLESGNSPEGYKFLGLSENGNLGLKNLDEISEITTFNFIQENTEDGIVEISIPDENKTGGGSFYLSGNQISQEVSDGDLISGLELDPAENNAGTRLFTEDTDSGDKTELYLLGYEINLGNNSVSNNSDGSLNLNRFGVDLRFTSGDLSSGLELDPAENNNGTRLYTEDTDSGEISQINIAKNNIKLSSNIDDSNSLIIGADRFNNNSINLISDFINLGNDDGNGNVGIGSLNFQLIATGSITFGGVNNLSQTIPGSTLNNRISIGWNQTLSYFSNVEKVVILGSDFTADLISDRVYIKNPVIITSATPSSTADPSGVPGEIRYDADSIYIKTSAGWKKSSLSTF
jgi:hypothetical protein